MADGISKSWFCVLNNPQEIYKGEPKDIAEAALAVWIGDSLTRSGAVAYCISALGLIHLHAVLEDNTAMRFSVVKKLYPKIHIEPTKGNKEQAEDYIQKKGKFEEKGEQVLYIARYGEIKGRQGQRKDIEILEQFINDGMTPNQIYDMNMAYRRYDKMIREQFFRKKEQSLELIREIKVYWHVGCSGSGKSYTLKKLCEEKGEDNIYFVSDYDNGAFDRYCGEQVLFLDEFRGQIRYSTLLSILQGIKKTQVHARFMNITALWNEVHITSVLPPEMVYNNLVQEHQEYDTIKQLLRRLTGIYYHFKENGEYKEYYEEIDRYVDYRTLQNHSGESGDDFMHLPEECRQMEIPFD